MADAARDPNNLGPNTERLLAEAFGSTLFITAQKLCAITGFDTKTVKSMTDQGLIRAVRKGEGRRVYAEIDVRAFLAESPSACRSPESKAKPTTGPRPGKVIAFSARKGGRQHERL